MSQEAVLVLTIAGISLTSCRSSSEPAENAQSVSVGAGSYTLVRPEACEVLPEKIFRTSDLEGKTPTNQWWSSLVWKEYSDNMFPHPLAMVCGSAGLAVAYPGGGITGAPGHIMGGGIPQGGEFMIGLAGVKDFPEANCADHSDWFITVEFAKDEATLRTSYGHGSPYVFCEQSGGKPQLEFSDAVRVWSGGESAAVLGVTTRGTHYGIFGASGSTWSGQDGTTFVNESAKGYFSVAILPDDKPETLALFARHAHNHVAGTKTIPKVGPGHLETRYEFTTKAMEGSEKGTLFALYPHQWKYTSDSLTGQVYKSVRGTMKLGVGTGFGTKVPIQGLLPMLPKEGIPDRERMLAYLNAEAAKKVTIYRDTYWEGKRLGILATLSGIAEVMGESELQKQFVGEIRSRLENWFTASAGEESPLFYYNETWGTMIGSKPSYGSAKELNDHHFHYGYFIRAAAEVARLDPEWVKEWGPMVELLIRDIASPDFEDPLFPHVRCFDLYAGHSWASGHAKFGDGNNQESSSESMNAWYALMLWGEVTGNDEIRDTGTFLYNTERTAVEEYWFDVSGTNYPKDFPHVALGMVWGGKGAYATWFSGKIDHIHGINWLPFTPASIYMGRFPEYVKKNHDRMVETREGGTDFNTDWGDLVVMYNALQDSKTAAAYIDGNPDCSVEEGNTHAFMYHWIHTLDQLGGNDASVTADHPFVNVYIKDGKRSYAAYNFGDTPREVKFSDGATLMAAPRTVTVKR